jgi:hypothetical protein
MIEGGIFRQSFSRNMLLQDDTIAVSLGREEAEKMKVTDGRFDSALCRIDFLKLRQLFAKHASLISPETNTMNFIGPDDVIPTRYDELGRGEYHGRDNFITISPDAPTLKSLKDPDYIIAIVDTLIHEESHAVGHSSTYDMKWCTFERNRKIEWHEQRQNIGAYSWQSLSSSNAPHNEKSSRKTNRTAPSIMEGVAAKLHQIVREELICDGGVTGVTLANLAAYTSKEHHNPYKTFILLIDALCKRIATKEGVEAEKVWLELFLHSHFYGLDYALFSKRVSRSLGNDFLTELNHCFSFDPHEHELQVKELCKKYDLTI